MSIKYALAGEGERSRGRDPVRMGSEGRKRPAWGILIYTFPPPPPSPSLGLIVYIHRGSDLSLSLAL